MASPDGALDRSVAALGHEARLAALEARLFGGPADGASRTGADGGAIAGSSARLGRLEAALDAPRGAPAAAQESDGSLASLSASSSLTSLRFGVFFFFFFLFVVLV
jgi:hypothetical protein